MDRIDIASASTTTPSEPSFAPGEGQPTADRREVHPLTVAERGEPRLAESSWQDLHSADELADLVSRMAHPVVVAFEDRDCDHCRAQRAILSLAWHQLAWNVTTLRVDCHRLPDVADHHRIIGYPTLLVFVAGQVVDRFPGRRDARSIINRLSRWGDITGTKSGDDPSVVHRPVEATPVVAKGVR